ncbi:sensor histidine kinase [Oceanomicrobium pacificus]|uniref:histidine kinase n=1 Tax=Oceanomicrobium pacificus TaxID=2692916 RepID=A0A6B0TSJ4_9RHOB|nr:ATP-binding protein [Oceanomicrobium pacificus]MXU64294.1 sensor histidine kinase [Oceanomicrobium pacificus]
MGGPSDSATSAVQDPTRRRRWRFAGLGAVALLLLAVFFWGAYLYVLRAETQRAESRASLYRSTLLGSLDRFQHLPFILARDPFVIAAATGAERSRTILNERLAAFSDQSDLDAIYLMSLSGLTIAASNHAEPLTFLGQNYGFRPYFKEAAAGGHGEFFAIGATTSQPGYFVADPVRGPTGDIQGVIALKLDLSSLTDTWAAGGETVLVTNRDGIVVLATEPDWPYRSITPLDPARRADIAAERQFGQEPLAPLDWTPGRTGPTVEGRRYLQASVPVGRLDWQLHFLTDRARVWQQAASLTIAAAVVMALLLALGLFLRSERIAAALRVSDRDRQDLSRVNMRLRQEVEDRRRAEAALARTRADLDRASKLAALGQVSASVTHELGQPIAALKTQIAAAEMARDRLDTPRLLDRLSGIATRMEAITRQLRFFAAPDTDPMRAVPFEDVIAGARDLVEADFATQGVTIRRSGAPVQAAVRGSRFRLEQVLVNLLRNARDAMGGQDNPQIDLEVAQDGRTVLARVADRGHGLQDQPLDRLQEPFHSTRASGEGMGLGLAISTAILKEHGGHLAAAERPDGGAVFTVTLPVADDPAPQRDKQEGATA